MMFYITQNKQETIKNQNFSITEQQFMMGGSTLT
jgi:hypothetical protein